MKILLSVLLCNLIFPCSNLFAQNEKPDCKSIINGSFYSYPKNSNDAFMSVREGEYQHELDLKTGDTSLYLVKWINSCTYSLKFIAGSTKYSAEVRDFLEEHKLVYTIETVTKDYMTYKGFIDKKSNASFVADTMWFNKKENVASKAIFSTVADEVVLRKEKFSDTSAYAVVYLYRPKKFGASLGNYLVFLDNNLMAGMTNGSGFIYKIYKEGTYQLDGRLFKQKPILFSLPIKFGKRYYIKTEPDFTLSTGSGWKPTFKLMEETDGRNGFESL